MLTPTQSDRSLHPLVGLIFGILASSTAAIFIRFAQESAPSLVIAVYRLGLASLILIPALIQRERKTLKTLTSSQIRWAIAAGFFLSIHFASWITSLEYTTVASSVVLVSMAPLFVAAASPVFLGEPIHPPLRIALVLALLGTLMIGLSEVCSLSPGIQCPSLDGLFSADAIRGDLLAIGGAISGAGYMLVGRKVRRGISLLPYITMVYSMAAVFLVLFVVISDLRLYPYPPIAFLWFLLLALVPQLIGHSMINWALRFVTAAYVSITLLAEPIGSSLLAVVILREVPNILMLLGGVLILGGIIMASRPSRTSVVPIVTGPDQDRN